MRKVKNDPGLQVGDKIIVRPSWLKETGIPTVFVVTKVNSRFFYMEIQLENSKTIRIRDVWSDYQFHKEGDVWIAIRNHDSNC